MKTNIAYVIAFPNEENCLKQLTTIENYLSSRGMTLHKIFKEENWRKKRDRPGWSALIEYACAGDAIFVVSLCSIAKNMPALGKVLHTLDQKKIDLYCIEEDIAFEINPQGSPDEIKLKKMPLQMFKIFKNLSSFSARLARQEGLDATKILGIKRGRKAVFTPIEQERIIRMRQAGLSLGDIAKKFNSNRSTIFKYLEPLRIEMKRKQEELADEIMKE